MNKNVIIAIIASVLISGFVGFYAGRYYETTMFKKRIPQRGNMMFREKGQGQRQFFNQGQPLNSDTAPTNQPVTQN